MYLREILNIRRKGTSGVNEVHQKLLILQQENERLRQQHVSIEEVERLIEENKRMKMELQKLRGGTSGSGIGKIKDLKSNFLELPKDFDLIMDTNPSPRSRPDS